MRQIYLKSIGETYLRTFKFAPVLIRILNIEIFWQYFFLRSPFYDWDAVCTKGNDYIVRGLQCTGEAEGSIIRNPGNFDPDKITGLPTSNQVFSMLDLDTRYDTPDFDDSANASFRNILEGFADPNNGVASN